MSTGYLCPSISKGGEYSPKTDGYAIGITLLVCLTNRTEVQLTDRCEEEFDELWTGASQKVRRRGGPNFLRARSRTSRRRGGRAEEPLPQQPAQPLHAARGAHDVAGAAV